MAGHKLVFTLGELSQDESEHRAGLGYTEDPVLKEKGSNKERAAASGSMTS